TRKLDKVAEDLANLPEIIDVYEVTGEYDIFALAGVDDIVSVRNLLKNKILKIEGIRSTVTSVILHTIKKDGKRVYE
ncbi:Lrp/AsnC ligand binding domain-containing protein, partial [Candidatus Bathyarchaeota archaeon]|nr:Lrp/AsnC ligand binding domain-containing protein [Candidatus Bathyarchaeota archaeon]